LKAKEPRDWLHPKYGQKGIIPSPDDNWIAFTNYYKVYIANHCPHDRKHHWNWTKKPPISVAQVHRDLHELIALSAQ